MVVVVVLAGQASLLADGAGSDVATSAFDAVLRSPLTAVAADRAGNAHSGEGELILTTSSNAGSTASNGSVEAGGTVAGCALAGLALRRARSALTVADFIEARWAVVDALSIDTAATDHDGRADSPAASLIEKLTIRTGETVGSGTNASGALEVTDFTDTVFGIGSFVAGQDAGLHDS